MKKLKQLVRECILESDNTASVIPMDVPPQKQFHVFDFDDTLVRTVGVNGISAFKGGRQVYPDVTSFTNWINTIGIKEIDKLKGPQGSFIEQSPKTKIWTAYVSSAGLAAARKQAGTSGWKELAIVDNSGNHFIKTSESQPDITYLVKDLSGSASVDSTNSIPYPSSIEKLKSVKSKGSEPIIMTARKGEGTIKDIDGNDKPVTNKTDIADFLGKQGISNVPVIGVTGGDKGVEIKKRVDNKKPEEKPEEIHFYDDDQANVTNVKNALAGKVPEELFIYGPGEIDADKPNEKFPKVSPGSIKEYVTYSYKMWNEIKKELILEDISIENRGS